MFASLSQRQKVTIIAVVSAVLVSIFIALIVIVTNGSRTDQADIVAQQRANTDIDAGLTELTARGVTTYQIDSIKNGLYKFARKNNQQVSQMTINIDSIDRVINNKGETMIDYAKFTIKLDSRQYSVRANLPGMSSAQVIITKGGAQVFDSGVIDIVAQDL